uniref:Uncharacterized protein n=1 Tax=Arundo donax TaxID=35708 RepID=A0A0A9GXV0_ARUDO
MLAEIHPTCMLEWLTTLFDLIHNPLLVAFCYTCTLDVPRLISRSKKDEHRVQ